MEGARLFHDRRDAGRQLAAALGRLRSEAPLVLALPRGGVPVAFEVARALRAPLDLILVRKIGAPWQPELAAGAVVDGERMDLVVNEEVVAALGLSAVELRQQAEAEVREIERRRRAYLGDREPLAIAGRTVVVVDDGIATGASVRAALRAVHRRGPRWLVLAVPVAPPETVAELESEVDELVCLATPSGFAAVGQFYADFRQVDDAEVRELLARAQPGAEEGSRGGKA
jgi:putative phosphoribosyl transferase